ncbi:MAG: beta-N-acetylhexosaminidase [Bacilli bacterium]|nr:beta-N-acetylhexosaminidase [Bacilli bacterium]
MKKIVIASILVATITLTCSLKFMNVYEIKKQEKMQMEEKINNYLKDMTLEEKIGQMLIISNRTPNMTIELENTLTQIQPGGFIFFSENFTTKSSSLNLINEISATSKIPMILSVDQEGGRVQRIKSQNDIVVTDIPPMSDIGTTGDRNKAYEIGTTIGNDLKQFGLNMDFAPVLDVLTNNENKSILGRSFGSDYTLVSDLGISVAKGLKDVGIIPVYKHFPGHGSTTIDSHYDLPVLSKTKEELLNTDLIPFQKAIKNDAEVIMIGHLAIPNITNDQTPSSLSKEIITNLLKKELNYNGIVITDALNMKALTKHYNESQIYEMAINAGVDMLLMPENPEFAITSIKESVQKGTLEESSINDSVKKILNLKAHYLNFLSN